MIVRNEMANIERCSARLPIMSAAGDWDTGSTDAPRISSLPFSGNGHSRRIAQFPVREFRAARNDALARAHASRLEFDYLLLPTPI